MRRIVCGMGGGLAQLGQAKADLFFDGGENNLVVGVLNQNADMAQRCFAVFDNIDTSDPHAATW